MGILPDPPIYSVRAAQSHLAVPQRTLPVRFVLETGRPFQNDLIRYGLTWWEDHPARLRLRVSQAVSAGRVEVVLKQRRLPGTLNHLAVEGVVVRRLKDEPPRWRKPLLIAVAVLAGLAVLLAALYVLVSTMWAARAAVPAGLVAAAVAFLVSKGLAGHRTTCSGLHCPGCRE
jgi:hypothetical protein